MSRKNLFDEDVWAKFQQNGFLVFKLTEESRPALERLFEAGEVFFKLSSKEKLQERLPMDAGYRPFGGEYSQTPERPDQVESFTISPMIDRAINHLRSDIARTLYEKMDHIFRLLEPIAEEFTIELARRVTGRDLRDRFRGAFRRWSCLQLNYANPLNITREKPIDTHEDGSLVTIMTNTAPGLELQVPDGSFLPFSTTDGEMILAAGEILWLLSGGAIRPTYHRVRASREQQARMALLFFVDIEPGHCEPWVRNETNANIDIGQRVRMSPKRFGLGERPFVVRFT